MKFNDFVHVHKINTHSTETSREMAFNTWAPGKGYFLSISNQPNL